MVELGYSVVTVVPLLNGKIAAIFALRPPVVETAQRLANLTDD